jgi:hypothetical protein
MVLRNDHSPGHVASHPAVARQCRAILLLLLVPSLARPALAQADGAAPPPAAASPHAKEEARQRFDRGIALYNAGDMPGALAEFQRAYRLTAHPVVLYNLALVHANMGEAALAVDALERLKKAGWAGLGDERRERAESVYAEVVRRVGTIAIQTDVDGALVLIDNIDAARTPAPPQRVTAGQHIVALSAPGYEPKRLAVSVAGQAREDVTVTLTPLEDRLAHLALGSDVPDVTVSLDGQPVGKTPFATELAFRPGQHEFEWHREGYVPVRRAITLQPGTRGAISVPMVPSDGGLASGGTLAFKLSETDAVVTLDGKPTVSHPTGIRLPSGRHSVRVQRAGFFDVEREVVVTPGANSIDVRLSPTPQYLGDYVSQAKGQRTLSYVVMGAGAAVALGSGAFLLWNRGQKNDAQEAFDAYARSVEGGETGMCTSAGCEESLDVLQSDLEAKRDRDLYGWIGVGVGAAAIGTGALIFALGNDPNRYAPRPESDVFGSLRFHPSIGSCAVTGAF